MNKIGKKHNLNEQKFLNWEDLPTKYPQDPD